MERNKKIQIYCLFAASLILGIFGAVCLYLAVLGEYNDAMGYFNKESIYAPAAYICMAAGPIFGALSWVIFRKQEAQDRALPCGIAEKIASFVCAALILFSVASDISGRLNAAAPQFDAKTVLFIAVAVIAAISLVVSSFAKKDAPATPMVSLLSFAPVIYCALCVLYLYFDQAVAVNSPAKFICQLTYLSFMLMFCAEAGLSLGRGKLYPRYIFALCCAVAIGGAGAVSSLAVTLTGAPCGAFTGVEAFVKVGLFLYSCVRFARVTAIELESEEPELEEVFEEE